MGVLDIQAGVAILYFKMKQTCEMVFVIDRIGGSFKVLSYSSHRFHEKDWYEERDQGPMSTVVGERIGGRSATVPPLHPPLIDSFLSLYKNCLPCGNNTIL